MPSNWGRVGTNGQEKVEEYASELEAGHARRWSGPSAGEDTGTGKSIETIPIEHLVETLDDDGVPRATWTLIATLRAQIVQVNTEELLRNYCTASKSVVIFQTRSVDGVTPADRLLEAVASFDIKEVTEIGRRRGLEIRSVATEIGS